MHLDKPIIVMPAVYEIPLGLWRWCRLVEVCAVVPGVAALAGSEFEPSAEQLVTFFSALARRNSRQQTPAEKKTNQLTPKYFRYSQDGSDLRADLVPDNHHPFNQDAFRLDIPQPYPETLLVPEGWAIDTLKAIRQGAGAAMSQVEGDEETIIGLPQTGDTIIVLKGRAGHYLVHRVDEPQP